MDYIIELHPPILVENLLPHRGVFELMLLESLGGDIGGGSDHRGESGVLGSGPGGSGSGSGVGGFIDGVKGTIVGGLGGAIGTGRVEARKRMLWCRELEHGETVSVDSPS